MRVTRVIFALALFAAPVSAAPLDQIAIGGKSLRADVFPRPPVPFADGVTAYPDIEYSNLMGYRPLLLDLYLPAKRDAPRPLVVWVHGGGWNRGDSRTSGAINDYPAALAALTARGYVVASVNYRLTSEARFPAQIQDVKAAMTFLHANATRYNIDPARTVIWGGSAGGHLAALAATTCGVEAFEPEPNTGRLSHAEAMALHKMPGGTDCVQAAVIWYGIFDLATMGGVHPKELLGCDPAACPDKSAAASPISHVSATTPPMLLVHGLDDTEVSPDQTRVMAAKLKATGVPVETLFLPDVDHGLIGKTPETTRAATLKALQRSFDFMDAVFAKK
jgi:acetyl esterase/lipase